MFRRPLLLLSLVSVSASGQAIPERTHLRIAARGLAPVEGRALLSDSLSIRVATKDSTVVVPRESITSLVASRPNTKQFAIPMAIGGGVTLGILGALLEQGLCESSNCDHAGVEGASVGAVFGAAGGGVLGAVIGRMVYTDRQLPTTVAVRGGPTGTVEVERCPAQPSPQAGFGRSNRSSYSTRYSASIVCRGWGSAGAELGTAFDNTTTMASYSSSGSLSTTVIDSRQRQLQWYGGFAEVPFALPLNPRVVTSLGYYRLGDNLQHTTSTYDTTTQKSTLSGTRAEHPRNGIGAGLGLAISMPLWQHVSLGAEERTHFYTGGNASTVALTIRIRP